MFPSPLPKTTPPAPIKQKSVSELEAEKAAAVSPFKRTMTSAGIYTTGWTQTHAHVSCRNISMWQTITLYFQKKKNYAELVKPDHYYISKYLKHLLVLFWLLFNFTDNNSNAVMSLICSTTPHTRVSIHSYLGGNFPIKKN